MANQAKGSVKRKASPVRKERRLRHFRLALTRKLSRVARQNGPEKAREFATLHMLLGNPLDRVLNREATRKAKREMFGFKTREALRLARFGEVE